MNIRAKLAVAAMLAVFVVPGISFAQSVTVQSNLSLQTEIASLLAEVQQLEAQLAAQGGSTVNWCYSFNTNLSIGMSGSAVTALQTALQKDGESVTVNGSFDDQTAAAVTGFQEKYASAILAPNGLTNGTGYAGVSTRAELNALFGCHGVVPPPIVPPVTTQSSTPISISNVTPSSGPVGTQITITGSGFSQIPLADPGSGGYGEGIWLANGSVWSYLAGPLQTKILNDNTIVATVGSVACPGEQSACSSNFSSPLVPGNYSLYADLSNGTIISNKVSFIVTGSTPPVSASTPAITSVTPSSFPAESQGGTGSAATVLTLGGQVTITGNGFTSTGNTINFAFGSIANVSSPDGHTLTFSFQRLSSFLSQCPQTPMSYDMCAGIPVGAYPVSVSNANGTSNSLNINVVAVTNTGATGSLGVSPNSNFVSGSVIAGSTGVRIGSYIITNSNDEAVNLENAYIPIGQNGTMFKNFKVMVNGAQVGPSFTPAVNNDVFIANFSGSPIVIPANGSITVDVYADVLSSGQPGSTNTTSVQSCSGTGQSTGDNYVCEYQATGQTMTIVTQVTPISVSQNSNFASGSVVAGSAAAKIGSYTLTNPASEPVAVSIVAIQPGSNANLFQNLAVYVGGTQFGATQNTLTNGALYNISGSPIVIQPQGAITFDVKADVLASDQAGSADATTFAGCSATGKTTNTFYSCSQATGQTLTVMQMVQ
jgi:peptidoglycan hydrolase-like protein with peptidoglycan-binding domain